MKFAKFNRLINGRPRKISINPAYVQWTEPLDEPGVTLICMESGEPIHVDAEQTLVDVKLEDAANS